MLLILYGIPASVLGFAVGRWWITALPPAGWFFIWCAFVVTDAQRGEAFNEIYVAFGISGGAAAALGVGLTHFAGP